MAMRYRESVIDGERDKRRKEDGCRRVPVRQHDWHRRGEVSVWLLANEASPKHEWEIIRQRQ